MQYMGSKARIAKHIIPIITHNNTHLPYFEPFVGSGSVVSKIPNSKRVATDSNKYLIALLTSIRDGWIPPISLSKEQHTDIRVNKSSYPDELVAFAGFGCSFGGKWFEGYAQNKSGTNYALNAHRALLKLAPKLVGVEFRCCSYEEVSLDTPHLIYCDPPYNNTTRYRNKFDSESFYQWCRDMHSLGHRVFISEYNMPQDFTLVWQKPVTCALEKNKIDIRVECLYTLE